MAIQFFLLSLQCNQKDKSVKLQSVNQQVMGTKPLSNFIKGAKTSIDTACDNINYAMGCTGDVLDLRDEKLALREVYDQITEKYCEYMTRVRNNQ